MNSCIKPLLVCLLALCGIGASHGQKVGLLLGTFVSDRWYIDQKLFSDRVEELGGKTIIELSYEHEEQLARARKMIADGIDVMVLVPIDGEKAAAIAALCKSAGIPLISYDRLVSGSDIAAYLSYDSRKVGQLQGEFAVNAVPKGRYLLISGPRSDNNSRLLREGLMTALSPRIDAGDISIISDLQLESWSEIRAYELATHYFASGGDTPDVVIAGNDALANGFIEAMPPHSERDIVVCGQDADLKGIRNIIRGKQSMTVYKPIRPLAYAAAEAAIALASDKVIPNQSLLAGATAPGNTLLLEPMIVDIRNYRETVGRDGHMAMSEAFHNVGQAFEAERSRIQLALFQKETALETQRQATQRYTLLGIILFFVVSFIGLGYTIYQKQNDNKLLNDQKQVIENKNRELTGVNDQLHVLNEKLVLQNEEILAQRDAIVAQNEKLEEVNAIIGSQRDEIQHQNEKLEKEVQKRTNELIQYIRQLEQYSFVTAHNLRAPVARIIGLCQLVKMEDGNLIGISDLIEKLIASSQELDLVFRELNTILDIRTFSMEIFSPVNLEDEVKGTLSTLKYEIEQADALIETDFSEVPVIISIKPYVKSILFNLISNAVKYRHLERRPEIFVTSRKKDDRVLISVADNGLGINTDYLDKIFQIYKRFHFHVEGRGIGLFLVKTQVDSLGGNIEIESEVGKGTVVRIWLDSN